MSSLASFYLIEKEKISQLKESARIKKNWDGKISDNFHEFLKRDAQELKKYEWSGYILVVLLVYLENVKKINLMKSEYDELSSYLSKERAGTCFILTKKQQDDFIELLNPNNYQEKELLQYYNDFSEKDDAEAGQAMLEGVKILYENIKEIKSNNIMLLDIG